MLFAVVECAFAGLCDGELREVDSGDAVAKPTVHDGGGEEVEGACDYG